MACVKAYAMTAKLCNMCEALIVVMIDEQGHMISYINLVPVEINLESKCFKRLLVMIINILIS